MVKTIDYIWLSKALKNEYYVQNNIFMNNTISQFQLVSSSLKSEPVQGESIMQAQEK